MKHDRDKTDRDLDKDRSMPGSSGSQDIESDRLRRSNLEDSEVGASSGNLGSSGSSSSGRSGSSSSGNRSGSSDIKR